MYEICRDARCTAREFNQTISKTVTSVSFNPRFSESTHPRSGKGFLLAHGRSVREGVTELRHKFRIASVLLMTAFCVSISSAQETTVSLEANQLVRHLRDQFPSIRKTIHKLEEAPAPGTFTIWDKEKYEEDFNEHLDDALTLLLPEIYRSTKEELQSIDQKLEDIRVEKSTLEAERAIEPTTSRDESGMVGQILDWLTEDDLDEEIRSLEAAAHELSRKRREIISNFRYVAKEQFKIELDNTQAEALLYQVNGTDLVDAVAVANILTDVETHIRDFIVEPDDVVAPKVRLQYYGFALIVRLIIERLHARHLQNYDGIYLPALSELDEENQRTLDFNRKTLNDVKADKHHRATVESNIRVLGLTMRVIDDYRNILMDRRNTTERMLREARKDALVARSTLMTIEMVMNFDQVASKALAEFAALSKLRAPDLLPLDDQEMYWQYLDISKKIA